ncbi:nitroreductase family protein [Planctomycetes bacterium K23_9]|uniref:Malonic semialdehyde reductase n=1 Tax=Stieleria marina TaxID=1930275 RepID=A0A517NXD7_9BACT|nr:malonic semialdehyde reductase [Planctomycetes bacterium K23_9]
MSRNPVSLPVIDSIAERWSPYRFDPKVIETEKLLACFEAARWAASSFNDQPWSWIVATRQDTEAFQTMLGCLMESNQPWASEAGALILTTTRSKFAYNDKPNRVALHDLGQAAAHLALQANAVGLQVHQMAGVNLSRVKQQYQIPDDIEPQTAIAIGYAAEQPPSTELAQELEKRQSGPRKRKELADQVFSGQWGRSAGFVD